MSTASFFIFGVDGYIIPFRPLPIVASAATAPPTHQTIPLLIIPTPEGGTKLQPLTPEQALAATAGIAVETALSSEATAAGHQLIVSPSPAPQTPPTIIRPRQSTAAATKSPGKSRAVTNYASLIQTAKIYRRTSHKNLAEASCHVETSLLDTSTFNKTLFTTPLLASRTLISLASWQCQTHRNFAWALFIVTAGVEPRSGLYILVSGDHVFDVGRGE